MSARTTNKSALSYDVGPQTTGLPDGPINKSALSYDVGHQMSSRMPIQAARHGAMMSETTNAAEPEVRGKKGGSSAEAAVHVHASAQGMKRVVKSH